MFFAARVITNAEATLSSKPVAIYKANLERLKEILGDIPLKVDEETQPLRAHDGLGERVHARLRARRASPELEGSLSPRARCAGCKRHAGRSRSPLPWLIEMARRGTEASQFLYNNAARPVFARTSAGKVFSRFQLWAWNSVKFRNEIYARARMGGFTPGSAEFDRFQRMVLADLFVMGLAGLFPTSLFGSSMPPPYSYMQDLSAYFFGDDREKDRAFYGTLPYPLNITKLGMPPAARMLDPVFIAMTGGDWDRFASNTVWTYFPFGRLARGLTRSIENPTMVVDNMFGIPLQHAQN